MNRILSVVLLGVLTSPAFFSGAMAAEANIGDFPFECRTPDGKRLKPKYGDIEGVFYTDIPAQREACRATVQRLIAQCAENTRFRSNTQDRKYPGCREVFEEQARECAAFFRREMAKCDGGGGAGAGATGGAVDTPGAGGAAALSPKCDELPGTYPAEEGPNHAFARCWHELANQPGCYIYNDHYHTGDSVRGSGTCRGGKLERGTLSYEGDWGSGKGPYVDGKGTLMNGRWVLVVRFADGIVGEGPMVDGEQSGRWHFTRPDGSTYNRCFRAGEEVGCN